jgi:hypothetical protein
MDVLSTQKLSDPATSRLARQLIASAPDEAGRLNDELCDQAWTEEDVCWLQNELAKRFGYVTVDWSRLLQRDGEYAAIDLHRQNCLEKKCPLVVVFVGLHYCTVQIDTDSMQRPTEQRMGGLTVEEHAAIDTLMKPYRRMWATLRCSDDMSVPHMTMRTRSLGGSLPWRLGNCDR